MGITREEITMMKLEEISQEAIQYLRTEIF